MSDVKPIEVWDDADQKHIGTIDDQNNVACGTVPQAVVAWIEHQAGWDCQNCGRVEIDGRLWTWHIV